jgi:3-oxoacyl-[acyl-carrier-protein] synthase-3
MIGVEERRWVEPGQTTVDLCTTAAKRVLESLSWTTEDIGLLIFVSQTPDYDLPASACVLHARLGLSKSCAAFDVNLGCSGYVYAWWMASQLMQSGAIKRALLLVGDTSSYFSDLSDRSTALLFGDAGSATALEWREGASASHFVVGSDGTGQNNLIVPQSGTRNQPLNDERLVGRDQHKLYMDGGEIFNFTLSAVPKLGEALFNLAGTTSADYAAVLFHQANAFMLKHLAKKMKLGAEQVPINMQRFGNTSSASIPLLMSDLLASRLQNESLRLAMLGFGVGYSWAAADLVCGPAPVQLLEL